MMLSPMLQSVASNRAAVDHSVLASGITQMSLDPAGVSTLLVVLRVGALTLSPSSV